MASNRLLIGLNGRLAVLNPVRFSSSVSTIQPDAVAKSKASNEPNFFQKIRLRWLGIPLKGETHPPKSLFDDCDKEFFVTEPVPKVPKDYKEHPERDLVNFPYPEHHAYPPKTRMFLIPNSWCTPFEKVTGTSGPYLFFYGTGLFLCAKEIFVLDENAMKICGFISLYYCLSRCFQYRIDQWLYKKMTDELKRFQEVIDEDLKDAVEFRKNSAAEAQSLKAVQEAFPIILQENLQMQLEAAYRENVNTVASELKRRIDYLQEVEAIKLRFERDILLKSITNGVLKQIENNENNVKDQYLSNCILQLKNLAV